MEGTAETVGAGDPVGAADGPALGAEVGPGGATILPTIIRAILFYVTVPTKPRRAYGTGSRPARAAKAPAARRAGRGLWRASLEIFRLRSVPWQRSWVCLFCAFFSSRARFDDESCSDKFGSKLSTVISLFNKSDGALHKISDWKAPALFCAC